MTERTSNERNAGTAALVVEYSPRVTTDTLSD